MKQEIHFNTSLSQQMTASLIQQIQLLQYDNLELIDLIQSKSIENPLIELTDAKENIAYSIDRHLQQSAATDFSRVAQTNLVTKGFLLEQIPLNASALQQRILTYLIDCLCERLFLGVTIQELMQRFNIEQHQAEVCMKCLKSFEPLGIGARDMTEFLVMQIEDCLVAPSMAKVFVEQELEAIAKSDIKDLSKRYNITLDEVKKTIQFIKDLPRTPTITIEGNAPVILPDATLYEVDGQWVKVILDHYLPQIHLHQDYVQLLKKENPAYLKVCLNDYQTLVGGIEFRKKTLHNILDYLIEHQTAFLHSGKMYLKPLTMRELAETIEVHESTISRAVKGKYILLPWGLVHLQDIFTKALGENAVGDVTLLIKQLVEAEPKGKPYSDQQLVNILRERGIKISRRTVTKYREQLNIPNSQKRYYL